MASHANLITWLSRFCGGWPSHEVQLAVIGLGLTPAHFYAPMACEVCGANAKFLENCRQPRAQVSIALGDGETLHVACVGETGLLMRTDNPLCRGEVVWLGRGKRNVAGCTCVYED